MATGLELLQFTAIVFTAAYYLLPIERPETERALIGIISGVLWFGTTALTIWELETGYAWSYLYLMLGILMSLQALLRLVQLWRQGGARY